MNLLNATRDRIEETLELIHASDLTFREIAEGSGVKFDWLLKFAYRKIASPGLDKVEPVYKFLTAPLGRSSKKRGSPRAAA